MANEFKVKNGLIVIGDLTTSGTITINGALAATQSWVTSQAYLTSASLSGYATQSYVTSAIASLVDSAPAALDTLNELAAALGDDANFSTTITNSIASKQSQLNGTGLVRMSGTSVSYDNTTYLISNFGNIEGEHGYGYPSSNGWYKIAEIVLTSSCQSFNLWGEYRDTGYFDNSHYRIHITARAECDFPTNNESHAINVNIYGSSTNETYFTNNVRVVLTSSSSNYRKYELQYYRETWDTGSWNLQTLGWTTYTTSQTAGTPTGTPRVYYISKFVADNIYAANKISIGTTYSGFAANIAGTTYVIGASVWVNDGYGISNASSGGTGFFPYSDGTLVFNSVNSEKMRVASSGNVGIGTNSPTAFLHIAGQFETNYALKLSGTYGTGRTFGWKTNGGDSNVISLYDVTQGSRLAYFGYTQIGFEVNGVSRLYIADGGNVGINTNSPVANLSVVGTVNLGAQASGFYNTNSVLHIAKSGVAQITFEDYQVTAGIAVAASVMSFGNQVSDATYRFKYNNVYNGNFASTGTTLVQFNPTTSYISTGNVGIGTTSPDTPLVVQGGSAGTGGWNRTATLSATYPGLIFNSNGTKWGGMAYDYSAAMRFWVNASNNDIFAGTLAMSILNNGNVGIGTSDPGAKLHVIGNAWINRPSNKVDNASCTELPSRVEFNNSFASGASGYTIFTYPTPSVFRIYGDYDGNIGGVQPDLQLGLGYLTVKNSGGTIGNIGIGTTSPAAKLHVVGNTYIQSGALFVDTIGGYTTNLISLAASTNVLVPSGDITIGSGASTGSSQPFGDFSQLKFDNLHSDTNRGPNKIVMHDNGSAWIGGFGIHSDTVSYYTGGHHRWYKTDSQTSSNQVMQLDASGNLSITGTFSASGYNNSNWNTAYGWGNHASAGYLTSETDTLASVTGRGASTSTAVVFNGAVTTNAPTILASAFRFYSGGSDGSTLYGDFRTNPATGNSIISAKTNALYFNYDHGTGGVIFCNGSSGIVGTVDASGNANFIGAITQNGSQVATTSYVTTQINNLIAGAPGVLDTLDELAAALGDDSNFATTVTNSIATKLPLAGGTMSGTISFVNDIGTALQGTVGINDFWRIYANSTTTNAGYLEIATSDDGTEPIYVRQYTGVFSSLTRTATLLDGAGNTAFPGNLNIGGFLTESSSLKLKENIETSEGNLEKVVNLRPVTYNKIGSEVTELGLIAEEVAEVYPEFVQYDENGEPIGVNYSRLTAALIGAVKELTNQVQELNKKING